MLLSGTAVAQHIDKCIMQRDTVRTVALGDGAPVPDTGNF